MLNLSKETKLKFIFLSNFLSNQTIKSNFTTIFHSFVLPSSSFHSFPLFSFLQTKHDLKGMDWARF